MMGPVMIHILNKRWVLKENFQKRITLFDSLEVQLYVTSVLINIESQIFGKFGTSLLKYCFAVFFKSNLH